MTIRRLRGRLNVGCCRAPECEQPSQFGGTEDETDTRSQLQTPGTRHYDAPSDEGGENWACLASLIETCKLNGVNPQAYFADLLTRLVDGWPQKRIDELMPWNWAPEQHPG